MPLQYTTVYQISQLAPDWPFACIVFFALNFVGAVIGFIRQLFSHPLAKKDIIPTIQIAAIMCVVVAVMSVSSLWMAQRRDAKAALQH